MKRALLACSLPLFLSLLNYENPQGKQETVCGGKEVPVSRLDYGVMKRSGTRIPFLLGGPRERARTVFRVRDEFDKFWQTFAHSPTYKAPLPDVDFSREMLVVAAMGAKNSPAYSILIESACEVNNQLEVQVLSTDYTRCGAQPAIGSAPLDMVRVPKTDLPVVFRETEVISDCKEFMPRPVAAVTKVEVLGAFSTVKHTGDDAFGFMVKLWKEGDRVFGLFSVYTGAPYDPPTGILEDVSFDPRTRRLSFTTRASTGLVSSQEYHRVPSRDRYKFAGVLTRRQLTGNLSHTNDLFPERPPTSERIRLRWSALMTEVMVPPPASYSAWKTEADEILQRRGPKW